MKDARDGEPPAPESAEERRGDRRALKVIVIWFCVCATLAALYLVLAIYVDWV